MKHVNPPAHVREAEDLASLAANINAAYESGKAATKKGLEEYRKAGVWLAKAKAQCGHGHWLKWLEANVKCSPRWAQKFMKLGKCEPGSHLEDEWRGICNREDDEEEQEETPPDDDLGDFDWGNDDAESAQAEPAPAARNGTVSAPKPPPATPPPAASRPAAAPKPPKPGQPTFDDRPVMELFGKLTRTIDARAKVREKSETFQKLWTLLDQAVAAWKAWQKEKA